MNGCIGYLAQSLEDFSSRKTGLMKNSRTRYDHAMNDYGVSLVGTCCLIFFSFFMSCPSHYFYQKKRKAQVRLGKGPETMDVQKYMEAAVEREISLVNYDKVTGMLLSIVVVYCLLTSSSGTFRGSQPD